MKLKIRKVITYTFDCDAERARINRCFGKKNKPGCERQHMLHVLELFEQGKFVECLEFLDSLGDAKGGYPEVEHVGKGLLELIQMGYSYTIREKAGQKTTPEDRKNWVDYAEEFTEFSVSKA